MLMAKDEMDFGKIWGKVKSAMSCKVDKVNGKGLSTNDYTNEEKEKLKTVNPRANVNVQADWNETDITSDAYINNKPETITNKQIDSLFS